MRRTLILLGVATLFAVTCTSALAASRGVDFKPIGFIDDPGPFPASLVWGMNGDGSILVTSPTPYGGYCTLTDTETLAWTHVGGVAGRCVISADGSTVMSTYPDAEGVMKHAKWNGAPDDWTILPAPDGFAACGGSGNSLYDMGGNADFATGLTWEGCSYARASRWDAETNTNVDLGSMNGDSSRGNAISEDGNTIGGWTRMLCGGWRGATYEDGAWSWVDSNGDNDSKACTESGGGCCSNYDCPEFANDGSCSNTGACDQTGITCDKTDITCDQTGITCDLAGITCDLSGVDCVNEVCVGGPNDGDVCAGSWNCAGTCSGGVNDGGACNYNSQCPGTCTDGPFAGSDCTSNYNCPGTCTSGPNAGGNCTSSSNCPGTCSAGVNEDGACNYLSDCPGSCASGPNAGNQCSYESQCPGTCVGGPSQGDTCTGEWQCPDTAVCDANPNWTAESYKGEVADVSADGEYVLGRNFGESSYSWDDPLYDPLLWASAYKRDPDGSFVQIPPPPGASPFDSWTPFQISDDGGTVVGRYGWWIYSYPVLWTAETGTLDLQYFLIGQGYDEMWYWYLTDLTAVSSDGTVVAGHGNNPDGRLEAFVIDISKVKLCHKDGTNAERTLAIGWDSIANHMAHGDELATCEFLTSGARSRSVDEFRPTRPANLEVPKEALDARFHDRDAMKAQRALAPGAGAEPSAVQDDTTLDTPAILQRSSQQRSTKRGPNR